VRAPKYEPLPEFTSEREVQRALDAGSPEALMVLSLAVGEHWPDWKYAQELCLRLANHSNEGVRANACLGLAYIARTKGHLDRVSVEDVLVRELHRQTDWFQWRVFDALRDINLYLKWNLKPMLPGDALELGFHRALRGEVPAGVHAITLRIEQDLVNVVVFRDAGSFDEQDFEQVVRRELDRGMPPLFCAPEDITFVYELPEAFNPAPSERVLIGSPWPLKGSDATR
jgi:hypothetical protein